MPLKKIEEFMDSHAIGDAQMAKMAGLPEDAIEDLKRDDMDDTVRMFTLHKLATAVEIAIVDEQSKAAEHITVTEAEKKLLQEYRSLTERSKSVVRSTLALEKIKKIWAEF